MTILMMHHSSTQLSDIILYQRTTVISLPSSIREYTVKLDQLKDYKNDKHRVIYAGVWFSRTLDTIILHFNFISLEENGTDSIRFHRFNNYFFL